MKNHSSRRAGKGKTGYRTPSMFRSNKPENIKKGKSIGLKINDQHNKNKKYV